MDQEQIELIEVLQDQPDEFILLKKLEEASLDKHYGNGHQKRSSAS